MFATCRALIPLHALLGSDEMRSAVLCAKMFSARLFKQLEVNACNEVRAIEANMLPLNARQLVPPSTATHCGVMLTKAKFGILVS